MKILVTGPRGFIASRLLQTAPEHQLSAIDRDFPAGELPALFAREKFDAVVHLATRFSKTHAYGEIDSLIDSNLKLTARLLECANETAVGRFITFGTYYEFPSPASLYAATKSAMAPILDYYARLGRTRITELYLYDTYGPRDPRPKILNLLVKAATSGDELPLSPGMQKLKLLHVDDVCQAIHQALTLSRGPAELDVARYALEPLETLTLREIAAKVETATYCKLNAKWGAYEYTPGVPMEPTLPFAPLPGWTAKIPLQQGLVEVAKS